ncbi:MAG: hypothetical protein M1820_010916, partial [Bogoriella megaspora]
MVSPQIHTLPGRLATFEAPPQKKRRASSSTRKKAAPMPWPHQTPDPDSLAKAGFYFSPSESSPDNVTCFLCKRSLDGWEAQDDPATEHLQHSPDCGWAIHACIALRSEDTNRDVEDPQSDRMVEARLSTFHNAWPYDKKKGWKCKTKKMVEAGWCYDPTPEIDDAVTCFYCSLALDGWEPKDDPMEEHRKRSPDCLFFNKPAPKKSRSSRASKRKSEAIEEPEEVGSQPKKQRKMEPPQKKVAPKPKRGRKASKASTKPSLQSSLPDLSADEFYSAPERDEDSQEVIMIDTVNDAYVEESTRNEENIIIESQQDDTEVITRPEPSPPPQVPTTSISPQSSNAENRPPSSKTSPIPYNDDKEPSMEKQVQPVRIPLAVSTPVASPSKRNIISGQLVSSIPWQPVDLETVFLGSPDKENMNLTETLRN